MGMSLSWESIMPATDVFKHVPNTKYAGTQWHFQTIVFKIIIGYTMEQTN